MQTQLRVNIALANAAKMGSPEAKVLWDNVEEIEAAMSHYRAKHTDITLPEEDMFKVNAEIVQIINDHPEWVNHEGDILFKVNGDLPSIYAKLDINEHAWGKKPEFYDVSNEPEIVKARVILDEALKRAKSAKEGSSEAKVAWDDVEEIEASISHIRDRLQTIVPKEIQTIRANIKEAMEKATAAPKGSSEAAIAWETVEELDAALSHAIKKRAPKVASNMEFVKKAIKGYQDTHEETHPDKKFDQEAFDEVLIRLTKCQEETEAAKCIYNPEIIAKI